MNFKYYLLVLLVYGCAVSPKIDIKDGVNPDEAALIVENYYKSHGVKGIFMFVRLDVFESDDLPDYFIVKKWHEVNNKYIGREVHVHKISGKHNIDVTEELTSGIANSSGGIDTSNISSGVSRTDLGGRKTTKVESEIVKFATRKITKDNRKNRKGARTFEDVSLVFDRNKGSIYAIYNRALRKDHSLEGKVLIELTIAPSGQVVSIRRVSSDLNAPKLEKKLLSRIRLFNFGAKNVEEMVVYYPIDLLPRKRP